MIGKVYESLVNVEENTADERSAAGIFYTPRTEIDLMCRLTVVDHLANHLGHSRKNPLYEVVFAIEPEDKDDADRQVAAEGLWPELDSRLREITVVDPACGSGSFLVGMLQVLDDLQERAARQPARSRDLLRERGQDLVQGLGYEIEPRGRVNVLRASGGERRRSRYSCRIQSRPTSLHPASRTRPRSLTRLPRLTATTCLGWWPCAAARSDSILPRRRVRLASVAGPRRSSD